MDHASISALWRIESPRLIGGLVRFTQDLTWAEDLAQEALLAALETWPHAGIPENPGAWLMTTAKNRAIDAARRKRMIGEKSLALAETLPAFVEPEDEAVGDDVLRLILLACHPIVPREGRVALTLRLLGGLQTDEIARAFLTPEPTVAQRIVRAKRTLTEAHVPFEVPRGAELVARLPTAFEVIYLIFNEGYAATSGEDWMRPELCRDAMRLARVLAALVPDEPEAHGLVALLELQASRMRTRIDAQGHPVLLLDQNRALWDRTLIQHGLTVLERAIVLGKPLGGYTLQAAIASCHARAPSAEQTDWMRILALYDALFEVTGSPVVNLNRAVAFGYAFGPAEGLDIVDALVTERTLEGYHLLPAVRGDLLEKLGRLEEAQVEFQAAARLATNSREKAVFEARVQKLIRLASTTTNSFAVPLTDSTRDS